MYLAITHASQFIPLPPLPISPRTPSPITSDSLGHMVARWTHKICKFKIHHSKLLIQLLSCLIATFICLLSQLRFLGTLEELQPSSGQHTISTQTPHTPSSVSQLSTSGNVPCHLQTLQYASNSSRHPRARISPRRSDARRLSGNVWQLTIPPQLPPLAPYPRCLWGLLDVPRLFVYSYPPFETR